MKRIAYLTTMALVLVVGAGSGIAQMKEGGKGKMPESGQQQPVAQQQQNSPCMMGPGMMGTGMMGYGMMVGYGYGMGPCKMGYSAGEPKCAKFLKETKELRKKLHDLNFEYGEALRDAKNTTDQRAKLETEMYELQDQLLEKAKENE